MSRRQALLAVLKNFNFILGFYILVTVAVSIQKFVLSNANNFFVFKYSFFHLLDQKNLYILHLKDHLDLYKYSPAFALMIAPIAILPDLLGAITWNLLNLIPLLYAVRWLSIPEKWKAFVYWIIFFELLLSLQNFQSNGLTAAFILLGMILLEKGKLLWAALFIALAGFIKIFGFAAALLFVLFPKKTRSMLFFIFWVVVLAFLPLALISFPQLKFLYASWYKLLRWDNAASSGLSLAGFFKVYLGIHCSNLVIQLAGMALLLLPLLRFSLYSSQRFRYSLFCSILIWTIIFNHKAEIPHLHHRPVGYRRLVHISRKDPFGHCRYGRFLHAGFPLFH